MKVAIALVLLVSGLAAGSASSHLGRITCPASETRLFVVVGGPFQKNHVNVYCGKGTRPAAELSDGVTGYLGDAVSDAQGNLYVAESATIGRVNSLNALISYDRTGRLRNTIGGLENTGGAFVDPRGDAVFAVTPHYEEYPPTQWKNKTGWIPHLTAISGDPPRIERRIDLPENAAPRFYLADGSGSVYAWDNNTGNIDRFNARSGSLVSSVFAPAGAMALGPHRTIYANGYGIVRVIDLKRFRIVRKFHDGSSDPNDDGPISVAEDGTLYVAHRKSARVEIFEPGRSRASASIEGLANIGALVADGLDRLYIVCRGPVPGHAGRNSGVYLYQRKTGSLGMYTDEDGRTLGVIDSIAVSPGLAPSAH